jgi:hypothetical protein
MLAILLLTTPQVLDAATIDVDVSSSNPSHVRVGPGAHVEARNLCPLWRNHRFQKTASEFVAPFDHIL